MELLRQVANAFGIGIVATMARPRHTLLIAFGLLVAGVTLLILLTIPAGLQRLAGQTGLPNVAMVLPKRSVNETGGTIAPKLAHLIGMLPGVAHTPKGQPIVAPQFVVNARLRRVDGTTATVMIRGVDPMFWNIIGNTIRLTSGAPPRSGTDALLAGAGAARGFVSLGTNDTISIHDTPWHVSGNFAVGGGFWESELWANLSTLQADYNAQGKITSIWVKLTSPTAFATFSTALEADAQLVGLQVLTQRSYYARQTGFLDLVVRAGTKTVALVLGLGAILATVNALGLALGARRRELAVLRSIGFERTPLAVALVLEVLVIAVVCTGAVVLLGWFTVNGYEVGSSTGAAAIQFRLHIDAGVIWRILVYLLALSLLSSVWPVWAAVDVPLTNALNDE
jgi:ABC-type lipoprotein release transport system permease subunit